MTSVGDVDIRGPEMFARYAYAPNQLGYCGPPDLDALTGGSVERIRAAARRFSGAWPYLRVLSALTGISDPLDYRLVESYWLGGGVGAALAQGLRRGLFSNEAGLGSAPNVAATADVRHPLSQGITQSFSVFIDTIIICSCTAFIILLSPVYVPGTEGIDGVALTQQSLVSHVGEWSQYFLTFAVLLFAFSSIIYNYYLGETALGVMTRQPAALHVLRVAIIAVVFLGATAPGATAVFFFSDPVMGVLAVVNLMAIMMLFPVALRILNDFRAQLRAGVARPVLDPRNFPDLDLDHSAWTHATNGAAMPAEGEAGPSTAPA